jgi:hypothetical protein
MMFAVSLGVKVAKSKTGRKVAKVAAKKIAENVDVAISGRGLDVTVAGKEFRVDRTTFTRTANDAVPTAYDLDDYA